MSSFFPICSRIPATTEHKIKYKAKNKLSIIDSIKMVQYAKIVNKLDEKITKINSKYIG